jgi:hypothetical protein
MKKRIIACRVFEEALDYLKINTRFPQWVMRYLPARLHLRPEELRKRLAEEAAAAKQSDTSACCLYGQCFAGIDEELAPHAIPRVPCGHCFEIFLGADRYRKMIEEEPGIFFLEKQLLVNFDDYCWRPLELDDPQMRRWYFEHYRQMVYIRQPMDPDLQKTAEEVSDRIGLSLRIEDADYSELENNLVETIKRCDTIRL